MPMDPQLAAIYGTNSDETDVEKLAAAKLAEELGEEEETTELTDEEAEQLAAQLLAEEEEGAEVEEPTEEGEEEVEMKEKTSAEEEAKEKLAEADYLGRVMAHAYAQELRNIAEEEQEKIAAKAGPGNAAGYVKARAHQASGKVMKHLKRYGQLMAGGEKSLGGHRPGNFAKLHPRGSHWRGEQAKSLAARGATGLAAGTAVAAGVAAKKHKKEKQSAAEPSALDILAERRALEILQANGIDVNAKQEEPATETQEAVTEKTSASEKEMSALQQAVEQRAAAMLEQAGYKFEDAPVEEQGEETETEEAVEEPAEKE